MSERKCRICGDSYATIKICETCKADPANDGWKEPPSYASKSVEGVVDDIVGTVDAQENDQGGRRARSVREYQNDDGSSRGGGASSPCVDVYCDSSEWRGLPGTPVRTTIAAHLEAERRTGRPISNQRIADKARCSEQYVGRARKEFGRDRGSLRAVALRQRRPVPNTLALSYDDLVRAAWLEYRMSGAWANPGHGVSRYGHWTHINLPIDPPRWFVVNELGFGDGTAQDVSLLETCAGLSAGENRERVAALMRDEGEEPARRHSTPINRALLDGLRKIIRRSRGTKPSSVHEGKTSPTSSAAAPLFFSCTSGSRATSSQEST